MSVMTLPHTNGASAASKSQSWLQSPVQKFFQGINWEDHSPEVQEIKLTAMESAAQGGSGELSLMLSVNQFFAAISWDGAPAMPLSIEALAADLPTPADDMTLDLFSDLF